jgi:hypothetical protein
MRRRVVILWYFKQLESGETSTRRSNPRTPSEPNCSPSRARDALDDDNQPADDNLRYLATMSTNAHAPKRILGMTSLLLDTDLNLNQRAYAEACARIRHGLTALIK